MGYFKNLACCKVRAIAAVATIAVAEILGAQTPVPVNTRFPCPSGLCDRAAFVVHVSSRADIRLQNGILHYGVRETLQNRGELNAEVDYTIPLPANSAFQDLTMSINGEMVSGQVMPAGTAERIYESIVRTNRDPALVEWTHRNLLRSRIFPIFPNETKLVDVRYQSVPRLIGERIRIDYSLGSRRGHWIQPGGPIVSVTFSYPDSSRYGTPSSPTHTISSISRAVGRRTVTLTGNEQDVVLFLPVRNRTAPAIEVTTHAAAAERGHALITLTPPPIAAPNLPRDVVVLLDVSKSMSGAKFELASRLTKRLAASLSSRDRFQAIAFAESLRVSDPLLAVSASGLRRLDDFLAGLQPYGRTNTAAALEKVFTSFSPGDFDKRQQLIVLATDGAPSAGQLNPDGIANLVNTKRGRARVFAVGIGNDLLEGFLPELASNGDGAAFFANSNTALDPIIDAVLAAREPILRDVRITATGVELTLSESSAHQIRQLYAGEQLQLVARYSGSGVATFTATGMSQRGPLRWSTEVTLSGGGDDFSFVSRLGATERVAELVRASNTRCGDKSLSDEILQLGMKHSIPTPLTSYLVIEPGVRIGSSGAVLNARDFVNAAVNAEQRAGIRPGSDVVIQIRNPLYIQGYQQPLIVLDGVPQVANDSTSAQQPYRANSFEIDPESIERIEVVRGVEAINRFGQRGAYGVILITTKGDGYDPKPPRSLAMPHQLCK